jgi:hypothetical protein
VFLEELYGEVNSVKTHTYKLWLKSVFINKEELHVSNNSGHFSFLRIFCKKEFM